MKRVKKKATPFYTIGLLALGLLVVGCSVEEQATDAKEANPIEVEPPIVLDCNYFSKNPDAVLRDNPNAPVDYVVTCHLNIENNVSIEPGVVIAFETDTGFWITREGSLQAIGTTDKPITFTGVDKKRGSWGGIFFATNDPKNEMTHTIIEYAGGKAISKATNEVGGIVIGAQSSLRFTNNLVQHCKGWGVSLYYTTNEAQTIIETNTFKENEKPLQLTMAYLGLLKGDNRFIDNSSNKVEVSSQLAISGTQTMSKLSVPYLVRGLFNFEVGKEGNLTIEKGTVIEMAADKRIVVKGSLKAVGTADEKIIIRGETAAAGSWGNIIYHNSSPNNQLKHVEILHAGGNPKAYHLYRGAVALDKNSRLSLEDTHFEGIFSCVLYQQQPSVLTGGERITYNNVNQAGLEDCKTL